MARKENMYSVFGYKKGTKRTVNLGLLSAPSSKEAYKRARQSYKPYIVTKVVRMRHLE